jgi:hypothetical protein
MPYVPSESNRKREREREDIMNMHMRTRLHEIWELKEAEIKKHGKK